MALRDYLTYYLPFNDTSDVKKDICGSVWTATGNPTVVKNETENAICKNLLKLTPGQSISVKDGIAFWRRNKTKPSWTDSTIIYKYIIDFWATVDIDSETTDCDFITVDLHNDSLFTGGNGITYTYDYIFKWNKKSVLIPFIYQYSSNYKQNTNVKNYSGQSEYTDPDGHYMYHISYLLKDASSTGSDKYISDITYQQMIINGTDTFYTPKSNKDITPAADLFWHYNLSSKNNYHMSPTITIENPATNDINLYVGAFRMIGPIPHTEIIDFTLKDPTFIFDNMIIKA